MFGIGGGAQILIYKDRPLEVTFVRMIKSVDKTKVSETTYGGHFFDVCVKQYWPFKYAKWRAGLAGGGFLSAHRAYTVDIQRGPIGEIMKMNPEHNPISVGYGGVIGFGMGYLWFSRIACDLYLAGRFPLPFFFKNYVTHPSLGVKFTMNYRLGQ